MFKLPSFLAPLKLKRQTSEATTKSTYLELLNAGVMKGEILGKSQTELQTILVNHRVEIEGLTPGKREEIEKEVRAESPAVEDVASETILRLVAFHASVFAEERRLALLVERGADLGDDIAAAAEGLNDYARETERLIKDREAGWQVKFSEVEELRQTRRTALESRELLDALHSDHWRLLNAKPPEPRKIFVTPSEPNYNHRRIREGDEPAPKPRTYSQIEGDVLSVDILTRAPVPQNATLFPHPDLNASEWGKCKADLIRWFPALRGAGGVIFGA